MRTFLIAALAAVFCAVPPLLAVERLNVVIILADDFGCAEHGGYGSKCHQTAHRVVIAAARPRLRRACDPR